MYFTWVFDVTAFIAVVLAVILLRPRRGGYFKEPASLLPFTTKILGAVGM